MNKPSTSSFGKNVTNLNTHSKSRLLTKSTRHFHSEAESSNKENFPSNSFSNTWNTASPIEKLFSTPSYIIKQQIRTQMDVAFDALLPIKLPRTYSKRSSPHIIVDEEPQIDAVNIPPSVEKWVEEQVQMVAAQTPIISKKETPVRSTRHGSKYDIINTKQKTENYRSKLKKLHQDKAEQIDVLSDAMVGKPEESRITKGVVKEILGVHKKYALRCRKTLNTGIKQPAEANNEGADKQSNNFVIPVVKDTESTKKVNRIKTNQHTRNNTEIPCNTGDKKMVTRSVRNKRVSQKLQTG